MKKLICERCGGSINPQTYRCEYCGTQYVKEEKTDVIHIQTFQKPVRVLKARMEIPSEEVRCIGEDQISKMAIRHLSANLADSLADMMRLEVEYDPCERIHIVTSTIRVVEPDYRF